MTPRETPEPLTPARREQAIANLRDENRIFVSESDIGIVLAELDRLDAVRTPEVRETLTRLLELERTCIGMRDSETGGEAQGQAWHERAECAQRAADLLAAFLGET